VPTQLAEQVGATLRAVHLFELMQPAERWSSQRFAGDEAVACSTWGWLRYRCFLLLVAAVPTVALVVGYTGKQSGRGMAGQPRPAGRGSLSAARFAIVGNIAKPLAFLQAHNKGADFRTSESREQWRNNLAKPRVYSKTHCDYRRR
jgi:hypothetical protein